jgi:hypothetical protein
LRLDLGITLSQASCSSPMIRSDGSGYRLSAWSYVQQIGATGTGNGTRCACQTMQSVLVVCVWCVRGVCVVCAWCVRGVCLSCVCVVCVRGVCVCVVCGVLGGDIAWRPCARAAAADSARIRSVPDSAFMSLVCACRGVSVCVVRRGISSRRTRARPPRNITPQHTTHHAHTHTTHTHHAHTRQTHTTHTPRTHHAHTTHTPDTHNKHTLHGLAGAPRAVAGSGRTDLLDVRPCAESVPAPVASDHRR